jgi:hypothetical protein
MTLADKTSKFPEDGVRTPKRVGVIVILILYYFYIRGSNPGKGGIFRPPRPAQRPTQPPVQWVPGLSRG